MACDLEGCDRDSCQLRWSKYLQVRLQLTAAEGTALHRPDSGGFLQGRPAACTAVQHGLAER